MNLKNKKFFVFGLGIFAVAAGAMFVWHFNSEMQSNMLHSGAATAGMSLGETFNSPSVQEIPEERAPVSAQNNISPGDPDDGGVPDEISAGDASPAAAVAPIAAPTSSCGFISNALLSHKIILNEIAWMGSPPRAGETAGDAAKREWIELKNISGGDISLSGWKLADASGKIDVPFGADDSIAPEKFFLAEHGALFPFNLPNAGSDLELIDPSCAASDEIDASAGWPAGNNTTKQTLERDASGYGWHTSAGAGGTPGAENSVIENSASTLPVGATTAASASTTTAASSTAISFFDVTIGFAGDDPGSIVSVPDGVRCTTICKGSFASGTALNLSAHAGMSSEFAGWSGACSGTGDCALVVHAPVFLTAAFHAVAGAVPAAAPDSVVLSGHLLISEIQIAGASSTNDFVKIMNPTGATIDVGGWKLRKKSQTGSDASIRQFPPGTVISSAGFFTWANAAGGFAESLGAQASSTETLAADNSVALFDASGTLVDAVAWGMGTNQYGEGAPYPENPASGAILKRKSAGGVLIDTGNNADDFAL